MKNIPSKPLQGTMICDMKQKIKGKILIQFPNVTVRYDVHFFDLETLLIKTSRQSTR